MGTKDHEPEPYELVQTLRDKLQKADLSRHQIEKLIPPSLSKRHCVNLPPYEVGSLKKQREEARLRQEKLEKQLLPGYVPKKVQDKYLNEFYELKARGKLSHLSQEMIDKLEEEIKASAANSKKHGELEEFLASLNKESAVPEQSSDTHNEVSSENDQNAIPEGTLVNREKKPSVIKVRAHDGSLIPCFVMFCPDSLCEAPLLHTEKKEPPRRKGPVTVSSRTVSEVLDALSLVTEYIQQQDLVQHLQGLKDLEKALKQEM